MAAHSKTDIMAREQHPYNPFSVRIQHLGTYGPVIHQLTRAGCE